MVVNGLASTGGGGCEGSVQAEYSLLLVDYPFQINMTPQSDCSVNVYWSWPTSPTSFTGGTFASLVEDNLYATGGNELSGSYNIPAPPTCLTATVTAAAASSGGWVPQGYAYKGAGCKLVAMGHYSLYDTYVGAWAYNDLFANLTLSRSFDCSGIGYGGGYYPYSYKPYVCNLYQSPVPLDPKKLVGNVVTGEVKDFEPDRP